MNVLARLIVGGIIALATITILENSKKQYEDDARKHRDRNKKKGNEKKSESEEFANEFSKANTHDKYLFDFETYGAPSSKRKITRSIKEIMGDYETAKIGRTGDRDGRLGNYSDKYKALYLLTKSKNADVIKDLEVAYIDKFKDTLDNTEPSIFGASETIDGWYYLYIAVA